MKIAELFQLDESIDSIRASNRLADQLTAKLKPFGFEKDRNRWIDADKNVIEVIVNLQDETISWALGKLIGKFPKWAESGEDSLESAVEVIKIATTFAKQKNV